MEETNFPKAWSNALISKIAFPLFFIASVLLLFSGVHRNFLNAVIFLAFFLPAVAAGAFFLRTGQLRTDGRVIGYRAWFRWQILPLEDIEEICQGIWIFGTVKLAGHSKRLRFFIEPENDHLLGFKAGSEPLQDRLNPPQVHPLHPALLSLLGVGGFVLGMFIPLPAHQILLPAVSSDWITRYTNFMNQYSIPIGVIVVIFLVSRIRDKTLENSARAVFAFIIGAASANLLRQIDRLSW